MLSLKPKSDLFWREHPESRARLQLRPLSPRKYTELQQRSQSRTRKDTVDPILFAVNVAKVAIADWEGVGDDGAPVSCTEENRAAFGDVHAFTVMPWVIDQCTELAQYVSDEADAAKNG